MAAAQEASLDLVGDVWIEKLNREICDCAVPGGLDYLQGLCKTTKIYQRPCQRVSSRDLYLYLVLEHLLYENKSNIWCQSKHY